MNQVQTAPSVNDSEWRDHVGVSAQQVLTRSRRLRLIVNAALAVFATKWVGAWAFGWLLIVTIDQYSYAWLTNQLVTRFGRGEPERSEVMRGLVRGFSATLHSLLWAGVWYVAGPEAGFFAALLLMGLIIPPLVYFSNSTPMFLASVVPPLVICAGVQAFRYPDQVLEWMALPALLAMMLKLHWARRDQVALVDAVSRNREMRKAAEEASVAKSQFVAMMSHELRTPLNAVIGYAEILEEDLSAEGKKTAAGDAARIRRAARDLLALINEVLDLSKIEAGRMEVIVDRVNVRDIVTDVIDTTAHIAHANGDVVKVDIDPRLNELMIDGPKFRQCLLNLVSNACKFTSNGEIAVKVDVEHADNSVTVRAVVSDTGIGIAPDQAGRLFQPFVQADSSHTRGKGGTGLGLVITRRLAQLMGGDVTMQSTLGKGSRFVLTIAGAWADEAAVAERRRDAPLVLVIEDENSARDLVRRALARMPLNVLCAATAAEGVRLASRQAPALIVLDIHLPDGSGWDLLAEFRSDPDLAQTPVLVVSIDDDRSRALSLGACDHLVKPVDRDRLAATVMRYLRLPADVRAA